MSKVLTKHRIRKNRILRELFEGGPRSLTELSRRTGLTLPMVSRIFTELRKDALVVGREERKQSGAGRPPIVASLRPDGGCVAGIDIGRQNTSLILLNLDGNVAAERTLPSPVREDGGTIVTFILRELDRLLERAGVPHSRLRGVGVAIPGLGDAYLRSAGRSAKEELAARSGVPVFVEHDVNAMALGELWFGAAKGEQHVLCINIGWGLGLGLILNGRLYYGRDGFAGEFGHIEAVPGGELCHCGKRGCLETVASGMAIGREARKRLEAGEVSLLTGMSGGKLNGVDAELVVRAAGQGDAFSLDLLEEAGRHLGEGIGKLINLLNPGMILFGGRVAQAGDLLLNPVRTAAARHSLAQPATGVQFRRAQLGPMAGARGAALLAMRDLVEVEHLNPQAFV